MRVAVFGSRDGVSQDVVTTYLEPRFDPGVKLVSGGARGVDTFAETYWRGRGGEVLSIRPKSIGDDGFAIEYWSNEGVWIPPQWPSLEDYASAAVFRDWLIASEEADQGVAFWHNKSRGTGHTITFFVDSGKPVAIHEV